MKRVSTFLFATLVCTQFSIAGAVDDLFTAAMQCDVALAQKALDAGADVNAINPATNQNALAAAFFCPEVTKLYLEKALRNGGLLQCINGSFGT